MSILTSISPESYTTPTKIPSPIYRAAAPFAAVRENKGLACAAATLVHGLPQRTVATIVGRYSISTVEHGLLLPILLYTIDPLGRRRFDRRAKGRKPEEFLRTTYQDIPLMILAILDFWVPQRLR